MAGRDQGGQLPDDVPVTVGVPISDGPTTDSLLLKTAAGTGWVIGWRMVTRLLGVISTLVLVRLLLPADFGLVALGTSFAQSIEAFSELGVEDALIREKEPSRNVYDTGFTLAALRGVITAVVILGLAWPAARFFSEPRLAEVLASLAIATLLDGFANIGTVDFRRNMTFSKEFQLWILPRLVATIMTMAVAVWFRSYWALIAGILSQRILRVVFSYYMHPLRPRFSLKSWRHLVGYSLWTWAISMLVLIRDRSDTILIGRMLNPTMVGIYAIGYEVAALPTTELVDPLCRASFAGFAAARNADMTLGESFLRIIATMTLLTLPASWGISLVADPLVKLAFGTLWAGTTPLVQVLSIAGTVTVFGYVSSTLFLSHAWMRKPMAISLVALTLRVVLLIVLIGRWGLLGGAYAAAIAIAFEQGSYFWLAVRHFRFSAVALLRPIWRSLVATAVMVLAMVWSGLGWRIVTPADGPVALLLVEGAAFGAAIYTATLLLLWALSGRPVGAETDLMALMGRVTGLSARWLRRA